MHFLEVNYQLILHETTLCSVLFTASFFVFLVVNCAQKGDSAPSEAESKPTIVVLPDSEVTASDNSPTCTAKPLPVVAYASTQKSQKSRKEVLDSIKIIKGKKHTGKSRSITGGCRNANSQHTELINIPLKKAEEPANGPSILTVPSEQKSRGKPQTRRVQFAEKIVNSTMSTGNRK